MPSQPMQDAMEAFQAVVGDHVPPDAVNITEEEVALRVPVRYRVRVRGNDMNFEVVGRFTGFTVPEDDATEVLILEFVSEYSFNTEMDDVEGA